MTLKDLIKNKYLIAGLLIILYYLIMMQFGSMIMMPLVNFFFKYDNYVSLLNMFPKTGFLATYSQTYINTINTWNQTGIYLLFFIVILPLVYKILQDEFVIFHKNFSKYFRMILWMILAYYITNVCITYITMLLKAITKTETESLNQTLLEGIITSSPFNSLVLFCSIVILGPIIEELIFRKAIYTLAVNKILGLVISSLAFGLMHTIGYNYSPIELLINTIPYITSGVIFGILYIKTDNIIAPIFMHALLNGLSFLLIIGG